MNMHEIHKCINCNKWWSIVLKLVATGMAQKGACHETFKANFFY